MKTNKHDYVDNLTKREYFAGLAMQSIMIKEAMYNNNGDRDETYITL